MCGQEMMSVALLVFTCANLVNSDIELETCSSHHQVTALEIFTKHSCQTRQVIIQLEVPSDMNIVQVIPSHVTVGRCSGSCPHNPGHKCQSQDHKMVDIPVMVVMSAYSTGMLDTQCSVVRVREDVTCSCGCHVTRDTCTSVHHRYSPHTCQCLCNNAQEAATCSPRHVWDPRVCGCTCRGDTWRMCPTGYLFDSQVTCNCILVHYPANIPLIILVLSLVLASVSLVSCGLYHKRKMEMKRRRESLARILEEDSDIEN